MPQILVKAVIGGHNHQPLKLGVNVLDQLRFDLGLFRGLGGINLIHGLPGVKAAENVTELIKNTVRIRVSEHDKF